jgi:osmotically inducible protein OsmC
MAIAERTAQVIWEGSLARGGGTLSSGSHAFDRLPVTWAARTETPEGKTSPEELIAAAHSTCFTMALALILDRADASPERITTSAKCVLAEVQGAPRITEIAISVRAVVPLLDEAAFDAAVNQAAALCPVSNALRGNTEISIDAALENIT